jgi:hypothetical protein
MSDIENLKKEITFALQEIGETFQAQDSMNRVFLKAIKEIKKAMEDIKETLK